MMDIMNELYKTIAERKISAAPDSYTGYLFEKGVDKICKKLGEECAETIIAAKNGEAEPIVGEAADLIYHLLVLLCERGVSWEDAELELRRRNEKIGNRKELKNVDKNS